MITMSYCKAIYSVVVKWDLEGNSSVLHSLVCFSINAVVVLETMKVWRDQKFGEFGEL